MLRCEATVDSVFVRPGEGRRGACVGERLLLFKPDVEAEVKLESHAGTGKVELSAEPALSTLPLPLDTRFRCCPFHGPAVSASLF